VVVVVVVEVVVGADVVVVAGAAVEVDAGETVVGLALESLLLPPPMTATRITAITANAAMLAPIATGAETAVFAA